MRFALLLILAVLIAYLLAVHGSRAAAHTGCHTSACELRIDRHIWRTAPAAVRRHLTAIAACESHGNPRAVSPSGTYRGKYQFAMRTWRSVRGRGDPARAPEVHQDARAVILYKRDGPGQWPVCGR